MNNKPLTYAHNLRLALPSNAAFAELGPGEVASYCAVRER